MGTFITGRWRTLTDSRSQIKRTAAPAVRTAIWPRDEEAICPAAGVA